MRRRWWTHALKRHRARPEQVKNSFLRHACLEVRLLGDQPASREVSSSRAHRVLVRAIMTRQAAARGPVSAATPSDTLIGSVCGALWLIRTVSQQRRYPGRETPILPSKSAISDLTNKVIAVLYPRHFGPPGLRARETDAFFEATLHAVLDPRALQIELELALDPRLSPDTLGTTSTVPCRVRNPSARRPLVCGGRQSGSAPRGRCRPSAGLRTRRGSACKADARVLASRPTHRPATPRNCANR